MKFVLVKPNVFFNFGASKYLGVAIERQKLQYKNTTFPTIFPLENLEVSFVLLERERERI